MGPHMNLILRPLAAFVTVCLFMLGGCEEKHEPVKPTVTAHVIGAALAV